MSLSSLRRVVVCLSPLVWFVWATMVLLNVVIEVCDAAGDFYLLPWCAMSTMGSG